MLFISTSEKSSLSSNTIKRYSKVRSSVSKGFRSVMSFYQQITPQRFFHVSDDHIPHIEKNHTKKHVNFDNVDIVIEDDNIDNKRVTDCLSGTSSNETDFSLVVQLQRSENVTQKKTCLFLNLFFVCCLTAACICWSNA